MFKNCTFTLSLLWLYIVVCVCVFKLCVTEMDFCLRVEISSVSLQTIRKLFRMLWKETGNSYR